LTVRGKMQRIPAYVVLPPRTLLLDIAGPLEVLRRANQEQTAVYVVSQFVGHSCTAAIARYLVVYLRRSGSDPRLSPWLEGRNHIHPAVHRVQDAIATEPTKSWTRAELARIAGASSRHLSRVFHEHAGMSIADYKNRLRVALARELISQTSLDMERVAERAGFESTRQLRRAWRRFYPTAPREARVFSEKAS
jgi:transcriptional regulator GlxA family with amidase domain